MLALGHTKKPHHSPVDTLNRLFRRHMEAHQRDIADGLPVLARDNVIVTIEHWPTHRLKALVPNDRQQPHDLERPVAIARIRGRDCLFDGGKRTHYWHVHGYPGPHQAYIVTVKEERPLGSSIAS